MNKTQQDYIRKQAKVKTQPVPPTMRKEVPAGKGIAPDSGKTETTAPTKAGKTKE